MRHETPAVDPDTRLPALVVRSDGLTVQARPDADIRDEVMPRRLRRTSTIRTGDVYATVPDGVATPAGRTARTRTAVAAGENGNRIGNPEARTATSSVARR
jgi:hypothetical protein